MVPLALLASIFVCVAKLLLHTVLHVTRKRSATPPFRHALCCCRARWRANRGPVRASVASALEVGTVAQGPPKAARAIGNGNSGAGEDSGDGDGGGGADCRDGDGGSRRGGDDDDGRGGAAAESGLVEVRIEARALFTPPGQPDSLGIMIALPTSAEQPVPSLFLPVQVLPRPRTPNPAAGALRVPSGRSPRTLALGASCAPTVRTLVRRLVSVVSGEQSLHSAVASPRPQLDHVTRRPRSGVTPYACVLLSNEVLCGLDREFVESNIHNDPLAAWHALREFDRKHAAARFTYTCRDSVTA